MPYTSVGQGGPLGTTWDQMGPFGTKWDHLGPLETIGTTRDHSGSLGTMWDYGELRGTIGCLFSTWVNHAIGGKFSSWGKVYLRLDLCLLKDLCVLEDLSMARAERRTGRKFEFFERSFVCLWELRLFHPTSILACI